MTARRYQALHFGNMEEGKNVPFHREHRSKHGRSKNATKKRIPHQNRNSKEGRKWLNDAYGKWRPQR